MLPIEILLEIAARLSPKDLLNLSHSSSFLYKLVKFHLKKLVEFPDILNIHDTELILFSLSIGNQPINGNGQTILAKASQLGLLKTIEMCNFFKVKDNQDVYGFLAAAHSKDYGTLECLVRLGYCTEGVLDVIIPKWSQSQLIKAVDLIGSKCSEKSVILAISRNFRSVVRKLNVTDVCLHEAVKSCNTLNIANDLISRCDVNSRDSYGLTPLHIAVKMKNVKAVELLIQNGADTRIKSSGGKTAAELCSNEMLKLFKNII